MNDAQLIDEFCGGNTTAFNTLVQRWQNRIHRFAYRYFYSHDDAAEITQKTFIRAFKKLHTLEDAEKFPAWIYRVANNLCLDEARRAGRKQSTGLTDINHKLEASEKPDTALQQKQMGSILQLALLQLSVEQRTVIIMKEYEQLKFREIAEILDEPENTVKSRMYYGIKNLRKIFEQWNLEMEELYYE